MLGSRIVGRPEQRAGVRVFGQLPPGVAPSSMLLAIVFARPLASDTPWVMSGRRAFQGPVISTQLPAHVARFEVMQSGLAPHAPVCREHGADGRQGSFVLVSG